MDVELAPYDLAADIGSGVLGALTDGLGDLVLVVAGADLGADTEQRREESGAEELTPVIIDLVLEAGIALRVGAWSRSSTMEVPSGMMMRFQTRSTRDWPKATWLSYVPIRRAPCGISKCAPVGLS